MKYHRRSALWRCWRSAATALGLAAAASAWGASLHCLSDSIREVPVGAPKSGAHRVREALTAAELGQSLNLVVSLRMRNFAELQTIVQSGGTVSRAEMESRYLPLQADYDRVSAWLVSRGLILDANDSRHTNIPVHGTVATIAGVFGVSFARVATADGEFTSAVTAPLIPEEMSQLVLGVAGLQRHLRMRSRGLQTQSLSPQIAHPGWMTPGDILSAYHAPAGLDGSGQTIGVFAFAPPLPSDLDTFAQLTNSSAKSANLTVVPIPGGPTSQDRTIFYEACLDTQWAAGIAPGAKVRVYVAPDEDPSYVLVVCLTILNEGVDSVFTTSIGTSEVGIPPAFLQAASQLFAQMSASGITILCFAGDSAGYGLSADSSPVYPATDPSVTCVGGTAMTFDFSWNETGETVWNETGGGYSLIFPQPSWQSGPGVQAGGMRSVPDLAAPALLTAQGGNSGALIVQNGFALTGVYGTSLSTPIWAGLVAIINQARAKAGLASVGPLGPRIYPLIGTNAFNSITVGSNGFPAGPSYDLCTGVGTPNLAALVPALAPVPPSISAQPVSQTMTGGGTVVFRVTAGGSPAPTYQWQRDGVAIAGATSDRLVLGGAAAVGGSYTCMVVNGGGFVTSDPAILSIVSTANPGRLVNLSMLSDISGSLSMGFVIGGAGTSGNESLLVRAVGPSIGPGTLFNVGGVMPDPTLTVVQQANNAVSFKNAGWGANQTSVVAADSATGAFALTDPTTKDSALVQSLPPIGGGYSATVSGANGDGGYVLTEVYDVTGTYAPSSTRLLNLSCLTTVVAGNTIDVGFVIAGATAKTLFIRASGPSLIGAPFNVGGTMADPQVTVLPSAPGSAVVSANAGWGGDATLASIANQVGAFAFSSATSKDSATVVTLQPNVPYAVQVNSASGGGGTVLVEIYEVP